jgi:small subunit ribosomal protein S1
MNKTKPRFVPAVSSEFASTEDFASLLTKITIDIKEDTVVKGRVVGLDEEVIIIDVGLKNEGRVPVSEFKGNVPSIGDLVDVYVEKRDSRGAGTVLSREKAMREESWVRLEASHAKGEVVEGIIFGRVKGGFTVDVSGVVAFLPGSQIDVRPIKDITPLMGISQPFQILKMDRKLGNVVVSRRAILEESRSEARDEMLSNIKEGIQLEGFVKNITDYGAFIDLGSVDGLLHVTDISWNRVNHPSEILTIGQKVNVVVIKFNEETKRISLGMKQLEANPWNGLQDKYKVGTVMKGKVTNMADYGAFVELEEGIEGLIHASEVSWTKTSQHPKRFLTIGQEVEFKILEVDTEKHRISLSIKQCTQNPWQEFAATHPVGSVIKAEIRNITDFGIFVAIGEEIDGMIHESDIAKDATSEVLKKYTKGDVVECKILSIDVEKERVGLGIRQLAEAESSSGFATSSSDSDSESAYKKGEVFTCTITAAKDDGIEVSLPDGTAGFIKKQDLSSEKSQQRSDKFAIGDRVDAKVISVSKQKNLVNLSIKALEVEVRDKAIKEYGSTDSGASLGDILGEALKQKK